MNFPALLNEIKKLKGKNLQSIRRGADFVLTEVNELEDKWSLKDSKGRIRSRSFSELRRIWEALAQKPAVHVDSILAGSGSSRNQPETLLANLPFIEHLTNDRKKLIAFVPNETHLPGTLREMDSVRAEEVRRRLLNPGPGALPWNAIMVVEDLGRAAFVLSAASGRDLAAVDGEPYARELLLEGSRILVIKSDPAGQRGLKPGAYPIIRASSPGIIGESIRICSCDFRVSEICGIGLLLLL